jgi:Na+/phosphate symporter
LLLPFTARLAGLVRILLPSREPPAQLSFLDPGLLTRPENALTAVIRESQRSLGIVARSLGELQLMARDTRRWRDPALVRTNERAINEIREATRAYLAELTGRYLSRRQRLLAQSLAKIARHVERIGDYVMHMLTSIEYQRRTPAAAPDESIHAAFMELFARTEAVLEATRRSLDPDAGRFAANAAAIIEACNRFSDRADAVRQAVDERVAEHELAAIAGLHFSTLLSWFDALVRHCAMIAREEEHAFFHIKAAKLDRIEPPAAHKPAPPRRKRAAGDGQDMGTD